MTADALSWDELTPQTSAALAGKLAGLYGAETDAGAFDALPVDKQQALLIFASRLSELKLWDVVERMTNVYGEGGVGIEFVAVRDLHTRLRRRRNFSPRFAAHKDTAEGFYELRRRTAVLHFLRASRGGSVWSAHFDLYSPLASPVSALRHLWHEKFRGETPDWRMIAAALGDEGR
ncbi:MAG: hypothetical protein ACJ741_00935, partial [Pyrinomonadaceae bacterium]